jgi:fructokinase
MNKHICVFGEVLFDHFPSGERVLGGAPFNVAWHLQAFAQSPLFISRIGDDAEGREIRDAMQQWDMRLDGLQLDNELATGRVDISIVDNEPSFDIVARCAYDAIAPVSADVDCRVLYHGSLALRETVSRQAFQSLKARPLAMTFVDINLRPPWWQPDEVRQMMYEADWVKLNADELMQISPGHLDGDTVNPAVLAEFSLKGLLLTHGSKGAEVFMDNGGHYEVRPERDIEVIDTVGAGDAFAAITLMGLSNDWEMQVTLSRAQAFASAIVGNRGATVNDPSFYAAFAEKWDT